MPRQCLVNKINSSLFSVRLGGVLALGLLRDLLAGDLDLLRFLLVSFVLCLGRCILQHLSPYLYFPSWLYLHIFPSWSSFLILDFFSPSSWFRIMSMISASAFLF